MQTPQHMPLVRRFSIGLGAAVSLLALPVFAQTGAAFPEEPAKAPPAASAPAAPAAPLPAPPAAPTAPAGAAPAETLETPYSDAAPPPPATTTPPPATSRPSGHMELGTPAPDTRPPVPIRERRRLAFLGEVGWNGLAGFG